MKITRGFDPRTQRIVGLFVAQLDDQLVRLKKDITGLSVKQLQWQGRPGQNTIGMLLAHLALVEIFWFKVAPNNLQWKPDGQLMMKKICGVEDDGLPIAKNDLHPSILKGFSLGQYVTMLGKARRAVRSELKKWRDKDLNKLYVIGKSKISYSWTLYHVLEHFSGHYGQILLLKHQMRDAGVLKK